MYDYGPSSNFQGFDFLASYVYVLCILFFLSSQNKRRRTGKKSATQSLQALYSIFLQEE